MILLHSVVTTYTKIKTLMFNGRRVELGGGQRSIAFYEDKIGQVFAKKSRVGSMRRRKTYASRRGETSHAWNDPPVVIHLLARVPCGAVSLDVHLQPDVILYFQDDSLRAAVVVDTVDAVCAIGCYLYSTPPFPPITVVFRNTILVVSAAAATAEREGEEEIENVWRQGLFDCAKHETGGDAGSQCVLDVLFPFVGA